MSGLRDIHPPRLERFGPKTLTGLSRAHNPARDPREIAKNIAAQWQAFGERRAPGGPKITYGVVPPRADGDTHFHYVSCSENPPAEGFITVQVPKLYCAVFRHSGPASDIRDFILMIYGTVLPAAGLEPAPHGPGVPEFIERYDGKYDFTTAQGSLDILVPIKE